MEQLRGRGNCIGVVFLKVRFLFTASFHTFLRNFVYLSVAKYSLFNILSNRRCPSKRCTRRKEKKGKREKERNPRRNFSIEANVWMAENPPPKSGPRKLNDHFVPFDIDTEPVRSPVKRIRPVDARGGIWSARKIRAAHGERGEEGGSRRLRPWKEVVAIHGRKEAQILGLALPYTGQRSDSRYAKRVCPRRGSFPSPSPPPRGAATTGFLVLLPHREVGTDSPLTRREPRCAIHFCPLTSSFPRLPLPPRVQGLPFRAMGNPLRPGKQHGERANLPSSPTPLPPFQPSSPPRNYSEIVFSRSSLPKVWLLVFRYPQVTTVAFPI